MESDRERDEGTERGIKQQEKQETADCQRSVSLGAN